jgi:hypothetical protein
MGFHGTGSYFTGHRKNENLSPEELENTLSELSEEYPSPETLTRIFTSSLKKELAHYLANKELSELGQRLDKVCRTD